MASSQNKATHWQRTRNLTFVTLAIWFFFSFFVHWFGAELNTVSFMGFSPRILYGRARFAHRFCHFAVLVNPSARGD